MLAKYLMSCVSVSPTIRRKGYPTRAIVGMAGANRGKAMRRGSGGLSVSTASFILISIHRVSLLHVTHTGCDSTFLGGDATGKEWSLCPCRVSHTGEILASNRLPDGSECCRREWNGIHVMECWGGRQGAFYRAENATSTQWTWEQKVLGTHVSAGIGECLACPQSSSVATRGDRVGRESGGNKE